MNTEHKRNIIAQFIVCFRVPPRYHHVLVADIDGEKIRHRFRSQIQYFTNTAKRTTKTGPIWRGSYFKSTWIYPPNASDRIVYARVRR